MDKQLVIKYLKLGIDSELYPQKEDRYLLMKNVKSPHILRRIKVLQEKKDEKIAETNKVKEIIKELENKNLSPDPLGWYDSIM